MKARIRDTTTFHPPFKAGLRAALAAVAIAAAGAPPALWAGAPVPSAGATAAPAGAVLASDDEAPKPDEFVVAFNVLDFDFDPHHSIYSAEAQIFTATYEGLFSYDPNTLDPVKAACRSYSRSQDGKTYTFYIRDEATWSDGSPLLARDFRDAWLRALDPRTKADYVEFFDVIAGAHDYRTGKTTDPASVGISVIADRILQVKLESRADYFTRLLCHHSFSPIHPSMLAATDWRAALPFPVNGPYVFKSLDSSGLLLVKNEKYWDAASVKIPRIRAIFTDDDADVTRRFDDGAIHWLAGPMDLNALLAQGSIQVGLMFSTHYWFFDCGTAPWNDPDVRRALALLLPWDQIRSKDKYLAPATTLVLPFASYQSAKGIAAADQDEAMRLLEKAGHKNGSGLPKIEILIPDGGDDAKRVAGLMKDVWEKLPDLDVELKTAPAADYFNVVRSGAQAGGWTIASTSWIGDFADPLAFLQMWEADSNLNDARLSDPEYDRLLGDAALKTGDDRLNALGLAETRLLAGAAVLPIYHSLAANVVDTDFIDGWYANALDIHPFKYLAFGERKVRSNVAALR
jgi:peptide/nickel transport system substrate-binding protein/oligopeptide transport system substrate-binding protein